MTNGTNISHTPPGFRRRGGDRLFAACLMLGLAVTATAVIVASRHLNERVDLTRLVVVDVKRARIEMAREIALSPQKAEVKAKPIPMKAVAPRVGPAPPPAVHIKAPPVVIKPPPAIRVRPVPAPPVQTTRPSAHSAPARAPALAVRPTPGSTAPAQHNAGSRLATGTTSTLGTTDIGGEGRTASGVSGAGVGSATGQGTGAGRGVGAAVPSHHPVGDSPAPPPVASPAPQPVIAAPSRPAPPPPKPEPKPEPKPDPPKNVIPDRAEAQIIGRLPSPEMPSFLADEGGGGRVTVEFTVKADGSIANVRVKRSDDSRLNPAAMAAARRIRARPAVQGGVPRDTLATATFNFQAG